MRTKAVFVTMVAALLLTGCGKTYPPTSGGRTASYWAEVLRQPDVELRRKAAVKLGVLVLKDKAALPALMDALRDSDPEVRSGAARSLGVYTGPRGREVLAGAPRAGAARRRCLSARGGWGCDQETDAFLIYRFAFSWGTSIRRLPVKRETINQIDALSSGQARNDKSEGYHVNSPGVRRRAAFRESGWRPRCDSGACAR